MNDSFDNATTDKQQWARLTRRESVDGCSTCDDIKASGGFGPPHDASYGCESNRNEHCSCSCCFIALFCFLLYAFSAMPGLFA